MCSGRLARKCGSDGNNSAMERIRQEAKCYERIEMIALGNYLKGGGFAKVLYAGVRAIWYASYVVVTLTMRCALTLLMFKYFVFYLTTPESNSHHASLPDMFISSVLQTSRHRSIPCTSTLLSSSACHFSHQIACVEVDSN